MFKSFSFGLELDDGDSFQVEQSLRSIHVSSETDLLHTVHLAEMTMAFSRLLLVLSKVCVEALWCSSHVVCVCDC